MNSSYEYWQHAAAAWGSVYFGLIFAVAVAYALWPSKQKDFDAAARMPLRED